MASLGNAIVFAKGSAKRRAGFRNLVTLGEAPVGSVESLGEHRGSG
jgi:hypothetical protein